jgi:hypothetical protein
MNEHYEKWDELAPRGMVLIGLGLSVTGAAIANKAKGRGWLIPGIIGLMIVNAGIAIFGEAVKHRTLYEAKLEQFQKR